MASLSTMTTWISQKAFSHVHRNLTHWAFSPRFQEPRQQSRRKCGTTWKSTRQGWVGDRNVNETSIFAGLSPSKATSHFYPEMTAKYLKSSKSKASEHKIRFLGPLAGIGTIYIRTSGIRHWKQKARTAEMAITLSRGS